MSKFVSLIGLMIAFQQNINICVGFLHFDGMNDMISVSDTSQLNAIASNDVSFVAWFNYDGSLNEGNIPLLTNRPCDCDEGFYLGLDSINQKPIFKYSKDLTLSAPVINGFDNVWHMLAVSIEGGNYNIYFDSSLIIDGEEGSEVNDYSIDSQSDLLIGFDSVSNNGFVGYLSHISVWDKSLNANQVNELFNLGTDLSVMESNVDLSNLVHYWPMNELSGTFVYDLMNGADGNFVGNPQWN